MSTPHSNLKKNRKTPLPPAGANLKTTSRSVPFRESSYSVDESKLLEEISTNIMTSRLKSLSHEPSLGSLPKLKDASPRSPPASSSLTDGDLMTSMMSRISQLEQRLQYRAKEIKEKDKKIHILEDKVRILQKARDENNPGKVHQLEEKCLSLQRQIHQMESFLADYGMVWVGGEESDETDEELSLDSPHEGASVTSIGVGKENAMWRPATSLAGPQFEMNFDLVIKNIEELNAMAGDGISSVQHTLDGARLKAPESIPLTLYSNGILMFSGPFRSFEELTTQQCLQDIMDGYFPAELQARYPDGVPLQVTDKRNILFKDRRQDIFKGVGQALGGSTKPSRLVPSNLDQPPGATAETPSGQVEKQKVESKLPGRQLTVEQFLSKLPSSVIKAGKVIDIRQTLGEHMQGQTGAVGGITVVKTAAVQEIKDRLDMAEDDRPPSSRNLTTLRIKSERGEQTYIVKMKFTETIGDLRSYLDQQRGSGDYEILTAFPHRVFSDNSATLQDCGLVPNAALHLRAKTQKSKR